jgi:blocked-early-in-transport protein 1
MARQGDRVAVLKIAGVVVVAGLLVWWVGGWILGLLLGR